MQWHMHSRRAMWLQVFLGFLKFPVPWPFPIFSDNQAACSLSNSPAISVQSKHIDIQHNFICSHVQDSSFSTTWFPTVGIRRSSENAEAMHSRTNSFIAQTTCERLGAGAQINFLKTYWTHDSVLGQYTRLPLAEYFLSLLSCCFLRLWYQLIQTISC